MAGLLSHSLTWDQAKDKWSSQLNPILQNPLINGQILSGIKVKSGTNVINHGLQQNLQGYIVIMNSANVTFYDTQQKNQTPQLTLQLVSSGIATISLYVF